MRGAGYVGGQGRICMGVMGFDPFMTDARLYAKSMCRPAENFALLDQIRKFLCIIYSLPIFSLCCIKTPSGDGSTFGTVLAHLLIDMLLSLIHI